MCTWVQLILGQVYLVCLSVSLSPNLIEGDLQHKCVPSVGRVSVSVSLCAFPPRVCDTCFAQQLGQSGPAAVRNLQRVLDGAEEVVQETKAHLKQLLGALKKNKRVTPFVLFLEKKRNNTTLTPWKPLSQ